MILEFKSCSFLNFQYARTQHGSFVVRQVIQPHTCLPGAVFCVSDSNDLSDIQTYLFEDYHVGSPLHSLIGHHRYHTAAERVMQELRALLVA
jgi:hypothetical protein